MFPSGQWYIFINYLLVESITTSTLILLLEPLRKLKVRKTSSNFVTEKIPNLRGEPVLLGALYSKEADMLLTPSLWNHQTVNKSKIRIDNEALETNIITDEGYLDRIDKFGLSVELKASFMTG